MLAPGCNGCQVSSLPGSPQKRNHLHHETSFFHFRGAPAHIKSHCFLQQRTGFSDFTTLLLALPAAESSTSAATLKRNLSKPWSHPTHPHRFLCRNTYSWDFPLSSLLQLQYSQGLQQSLPTAAPFS